MKKTLIVFLLLISCCAYGVPGLGALRGARQDIVGVYPALANLCLIVGALVGTIGGLRIYIIWNRGDRNIGFEILGWFGSCLFLVLSGAFIKALLL